MLFLGSEMAEIKSRAANMGSAMERLENWENWDPWNSDLPELSLPRKNMVKSILLSFLGPPKLDCVKSATLLPLADAGTNRERTKFCEFSK